MDVAALPRYRNLFSTLTFPRYPLLHFVNFCLSRNTQKLTKELGCGTAGSVCCGSVFGTGCETHLPLPPRDALSRPRTRKVRMR